MFKKMWKALKKLFGRDLEYKPVVQHRMIPNLPPETAKIYSVLAQGGRYTIDDIMLELATQNVWIKRKSTTRRLSQLCTDGHIRRVGKGVYSL